ncbi:DedA family protein [Arenibaculum pallidiluteum]|uniref:DedA family protein n=1 Tax=Arenibaculum pallidiluteum TaxID=2812559 RepID=UPI001A96FDEC|nr:DedA family protein [Arenibaculum pallidiluteum]
MDIFELIRDYGQFFYAIVAVWTFLEGETVVLVAGVAAREGMLDLGTLIACAWGGSFLGDQLYFYVGRRYGPALLRRWPRMQCGVDKALSLLDRYSTGFILTFRFVYGVRNVSSFAMGMSSISWRRFATLNFVAAGLWAIAFAGGGYLAGAALQHVLGPMAEGVGLGLLLVLVLVVVTVSVAKRFRRRPA